MTESVNPASDDHQPPAEVVGADADDAGPGTDQGVELTGNPQVDEAVRSVLELGDRPVEEHVEVFEQAHSALRGALNDAAAGRPGQG